MKKEKSKKSTSIDLFLFSRAWFRNQGLYFATSSKSVLIKFTFNLCRSDHNSAARPGVAAGLRADAPGALRGAVLGWGDARARRPGDRPGDTRPRKLRACRIFVKRANSSLWHFK